ncbi:MAG: hypothetical protein ABI867_30970 [Kofleriaceae bacterium]
MAVRFVALAITIVTACGAAPRNKVTWPDAPIALRDDTDRDAAIDHLWVMPAGPERDRARSDIAVAIARRMADAVQEDHPFVAATLLDQLIWMWQSDPAAIAQLAPHAELLRQLRGVFAKAGALEPTIETLIVLAELEPANRAAHLAEVDEILAFSDELAIAENGANAIRAQPLTLLQPTALALPLPWLVDRYVAMLVERQVAVASLLDPANPAATNPGSSGATMELVRAHHDILSTSRRIANVLARANRSSEIHRHLVRIKGIGADREVSARAEIVADHPTAEAYAELANVLRAVEHALDPAAALALCLAGLTKFPGDATLLAAAGGDARTLNRIDQSIVLYEAALHASTEVDTTLALRLGKLYGDRIDRLASSGRPAAANTAWREAQIYTAKAARKHPNVVWQQAAAIAESALGKGLASVGLVDDGRRALTASLERAPSTDAYETLSTIDTQVARYREAQRWAAAGLAMLGTASTGDRYRRAKLERLAGDALRRAGKPRDAAAHYLDSLRAWASLGETKDLPRAIGAERLLDSGRAMWWLGDNARGIDLVSAAVDQDDDSPTITAGAVAFMIEAGRYREALDAFHRGLGEPNGNELYKVYMSLWILAEGTRLGEPRDRLAIDYLASRRGDLWYELLARAATGKISYDVLKAAATTGPRRGELAFYGAVLELDPAAKTPDGKRRLLEEVIKARVVLDTEYDLARRYLAP